MTPGFPAPGAANKQQEPLDCFIEVLNLNVEPQNLTAKVPISIQMEHGLLRNQRDLPILDLEPVERATYHIAVPIEHDAPTGHKV
uniref:Uncharacterized protein n=1 Tax=Candidatus Kentrum sp. UNK TaxID=2126344 RepID=A0A451ABE5_9GAMM|nr:MAG: hypothetical protein BECKUNK1418G_GA0071005_103217 [Candidatus Kentron sp. UNK]